MANRVRCKASHSDERTVVCLVAKNFDDPRRLPLLAVKVSTGKAQEKGIEYYLKSEWKEGWSNWLKEAKDSFPSVLEHSVFTFFIEGCSRVCSHQLVRHRLLSVTQESQRYSEVRILKAFKKAFGKELGWDEIIKVLNASSQDLSEFEERLIIKDLEERGIGCKELSKKLEEIVGELFVIPESVERATAVLSMMHSLYSYALCRSSAPMEDCRFLLPQAIRTSMLVTANLREWLHIIELRDHPKAQWEIRGVARAVKELLKEEVPEVLA